ncbi:MarR family winged helix-turn-helix transcriptional regulator [Deinococcus sp.]|uniref:MarR family winged helix-turn-helix transcriptional regulator n=1 Tax=Deinococcus sp. TaxID=47478 RepID=UPI003C7A5304
MTDAPLTPQQLQVWRTFRKLRDHVGGAVDRELTEAAALGASEYIALALLAEAEAGRMRQQTLAEKLGLHKSRLSHLLTRLEGRGLVQRQPLGNKGVTVVITAQGRELQRQGEAAYHRALRRHFIGLLRPDQLGALLEIADQLGVKPRSP